MSRLPERRWRPIGLFAAVVLGTAALFWLRPASSPPAKGVPASGEVPMTAESRTKGKSEASPRIATVPVVPPTVASPTAPAALPAPALEGESQLADELNAAGGTIQRDLSLLEEVFGMWQTNFPRTGNPVGENAEITAALVGDNPAKFAFIPRRHRAINAGGELCDRWGTPFRFHQISGRQMEIRSAGPDRKFGTADDAAIGSPE